MGRIILSKQSIHAQWEHFATTRGLSLRQIAQHSSSCWLSLGVDVVVIILIRMLAVDCYSGVVAFKFQEM